MNSKNLLSADEFYATEFQCLSASALDGDAWVQLNRDGTLDIADALSLEVGRTETSVDKLVRLTQGAILDRDRIGGEPLKPIVGTLLVAHLTACIPIRIAETMPLGSAPSVMARFGIPIADVRSDQRAPAGLQLKDTRQAWLAKAAEGPMSRRQGPASEDYNVEPFAEVAADACA